MAGIVIDLTVDEHNLGRRFRELRGAIEDPEPLLDGIGSALVSLLDLQFRESKDPYGNPWAPLTSRQGQPLRDTGTHIQSSLNHQVSGQGVNVGSSFEHINTHQHGATIRPVRARMLRFQSQGQTVFAKKVDIPQRKIFPDAGLPEDWKEEIADEIEFHVDRIIRG